LQRVLTIAILVGLLIATSAAFVVTERLKLEKSPISGTRIAPKDGFSPICGCDRSSVTVRVRLRRSDRVTVRILDSHRHTVRLLVDGKALRRGFASFRWDGHTDVGARAPDGTYNAQIHLAAQHQTIVVPNPIVLDTVVPKVLDVKASPPVFSPDGDFQADRVRLRYTLSKPAHALLYVNGERLTVTRTHRPTGELRWSGTIDGAVVPAGAYRLEVGATDLAGNSTPPAGRFYVDVRVRFIELASHRITAVRAGRRFSIGVSTDALRYRWQLGKRKSVAHGSLLVLHAPTKPGRYTLTVREHGHADRATVIVR
jgi:hypothetical protein